MDFLTQFFYKYKVFLIAGFLAVGIGVLSWAGLRMADQRQNKTAEEEIYKKRSPLSKRKKNTKAGF